VPEAGLGPAEVGKEIGEHRHHATEQSEARDRVITIVEASLLAVVALMAAWSGYASAKWSTESRLLVARASTARVQATQEATSAEDLRNFDSSTFNTWFTAYVVGNQQAMNIAERRFRPEFKVAFEAWLATHPDTNPTAPPGPTYMKEYKQPEAAKAKVLDARADDLFAEGAKAGSTADDYVRTTVLLASVLFLVGISGHFRVRIARVGLVVVASAILLVALSVLVTAPRPPA
jgi:hypothetical protein